MRGLAESGSWRGRGQGPRQGEWPQRGFPEDTASLLENTGDILTDTGRGGFWLRLLWVKIKSESKHTTPLSEMSHTKSTV